MEDSRGGTFREERTATSDSVQSQNTAVSRDSIMSMSSKLLSMESELDKTLRDLDPVGGSEVPRRGSFRRTEHSKSPHHSRSPSASYRYSARSVNRTGAVAGTANGGSGGVGGSSRGGGQRRSGSFDPLASSRRSGSVETSSRGGGQDGGVDPRVHSDLKEKCVQLELDKELVENKYTQQRKRLTLAKRENDELRTTLDAAIAEIGKLGEEAQMSHAKGNNNKSNNGNDSSALQAANARAAAAEARAAEANARAQAADADAAAAAARWQERLSLSSSSKGLGDSKELEDKVLELEKALAASQRETTEAQDAAKKAAKEMQASLDAAQSARAQAEEAAAAADAKKAHAEAQLAQALEHAIAQSSSSSSGGGSPSASSAAALAAAQQEAKDLRNEVAALKLSLEEERNSKSEERRSHTSLGLSGLTDHSSILPHQDEPSSSSSSANHNHNNSSTARSSLLLYQGTNPPTPAATGSSTSPELERPDTEESAAAVAAAADGQNDDESASVSSSESGAANLVKRAQFAFQKNPLQGSLCVAVVALLGWVLSSEAFYAHRTRHVTRRLAHLEGEYGRACTTLGLDSQDPAVPFAATVTELFDANSACASRAVSLELNATGYGRCLKDLSNERGVTETLLAELQSLEKDPSSAKAASAAAARVKQAQQAANSKSSGNDNGSSSSWFGLGGSKNKKASSSAFGDDSSSSGGGGVGGTFGGGGGSQTSAALYQCRKEAKAEAASRLEATIERDSALEQLHVCAQERSRLGASASSSEAEFESCEARLLKQDAWAASLAATNSVLHGHLKDANDQVAQSSASAADATEAASKCESAYAALAVAKESAASTASSLLVRVHTFENTTASLEAEKSALNSQLASTSQQRDDCKAQATRDAAAISKLDRDLASSRVAVKSAETQLATAESRLKELRKSLSESESQLRSFEKAAAKSGSTAKTFEKRHSQQAAASAVHAAENSALEKRNAELTALVAEGHKAKAQLEVDRNAKAKRLFELEQAVAAMHAAERVVSAKELNDKASVEACTPGRLCLKVDTLGSGLGRAASALAGAAANRAGLPLSFPRGGGGSGSGSGEETPGLVAIAGAVAAVWVFAVVMEKRKQNHVPAA